MTAASPVPEQAQAGGGAPCGVAEGTKEGGDEYPLLIGGGAEAGDEAPKGPRAHPPPGVDGDGGQPLLLFVRFFDVETQSVRLLGSVVVRSEAMPGEVLTPALRRNCGVTPDDMLMFEEATERTINAVSFKETLDAHYIVSGDVIVVQSKAAAKRLHAQPQDGMFAFADDFLRHLYSKIEVLAYKSDCGALDEAAPIVMTLDRATPYQEIKRELQAHTGFPDPKLPLDQVRLIKHVCNRHGTRRDTVMPIPGIEMTLEEIVHESMVTYSNRATLIYECLPMPELELCKKKKLSIEFCVYGSQEGVPSTRLYDRSLAVKAMLQEAASHPDAATSLCSMPGEPAVPLHARVRMLEIQDHWIIRIVGSEEIVENLEEDLQYRIETIPTQQEGVPHANLWPLQWLDPGFQRRYGKPLLIRFIQREPVADLKTRIEHLVGPLDPHVDVSVSYCDPAILPEIVSDLDDTVDDAYRRLRNKSGLHLRPCFVMRKKDTLFQPAHFALEHDRGVKIH